MQPQVIAGRYEVTRAIGSGGMGTVWLARDTVLGREVAIKRVGALPGEPAAAARAMREARIAASLNDAHVVGVYDIVDEDDAHWLVMEYVDGQSLAEQIRDEGPLPVARVAGIGALVARALAKAHQRGIVHRDIKPGNILITKSGNPKISDFGIARAHADDQLTQTGFMTGTPSYLSPELARGGDPTSASDVWALGATLYSAVEGAPAYEAQANPLATLQMIASGSPRPMELAGPLGGAIAAMMAPEASDRWDMTTAADHLDRIARGDMTMPLPVGAAFGAGATELLPEPMESTQRLGAAPVDEPPAYVPPAGPDDEPRRPGGRGWIIAALVLLLLGLALAYALTSGFGSNTPTPGTTTTVTSTNTKTVSPSRPPSSSTSSSSSSSSSTSAPPRPRPRRPRPP
ncbi:serine/threonine-protein kinase [Nostocoides sp. HKS02]|uniref:serine/threonine-protein kinase n=1 Tax=Nostocoides sp. HKS02 TaxID=1813880 RepID=UPI0012B4F915|nr:serine/threonine-protein kinase [Tetrasphaera sp. HKS02]QGN56768.1 protein kinase [Tetrasphaera sp. HKS02]